MSPIDRDTIPSCVRLARSAWSSSTRLRCRATLASLAIFALPCLLGCPGPRNGGDPASITNYPPADSYDVDPEFIGEWYGDVDGLRGTLVIGPIGEQTFYGSFVSDDETREYTLLLDHSYVQVPNEGMVPSNRTTFTWQDGLGSRGKGWLLIDRSDRALSGSFGFGVATTGLGAWSFIRDKSPS